MEKEKRYLCGTDFAKEGSQDLDVVSVAERLENGSIHFHESIVIPKKRTKEEQEKERQRILKEINQKYKD